MRLRSLSHGITLSISSRKTSALSVDFFFGVRLAKVSWDMRFSSVFKEKNCIKNSFLSVDFFFGVRLEKVS